ncbi:MAG: hypothetical protein H0Z35_12545 [Thermoanaerobacteraceae bacterium]|nr:hypothetical protein [Thermoanaerobacteraceae bacterium]
MREYKFLKYGGIKFKPLAEPEEINRFVAQLPEQKRNSLYSVAEELRKAGLIFIPNDGEFTTVDTDMEPYLD